MDLARAVTGLERGGKLVLSLVEGVDPAFAARRPAPGKWSLLEVSCHMLDEEREDFRVRLEHALRGDAGWPPIDPEGWVTARRYAEQDLAPVLAAFADERRRSVAWLSGLSSPDWDRAVEHPALGTLTAGDFMTSWLDHDLLHTRQMLAIHHALLVQDAAPHTPDYAGGRWD